MSLTLLYMLYKSLLCVFYQGDYRMDGQDQLICCSAEGEGQFTGGVYSKQSQNTCQISKVALPCIHLSNPL